MSITEAQADAAIVAAGKAALDIDGPMNVAVYDDDANLKAFVRIDGRNRILVARSFDAWRNGTGSPYDLLADDVSWTITGNSLASKTYSSKEAFLAEVIHPFNARMATRLVPTVQHLYAEGDTVIALFDAQGAARDGETYSNTYAWFLQMKDERIVRAHAFFDSIAFDNLWRRVTPAEG